MPKLIHAADVHLGAKFLSFGEKANQQREQLKKTFENIINKAVEEKADFLLIAGDLFDANRVHQSLVDFVKTQFKKLKENDIQAVIIPGTHDCLSPDSVYLREGFAKEFPNVHVFNDPAVNFKIFEEFDLTIWAKPNVSNKSTKSPVVKLEPKDKKTKYNILMAHGSLQIPGKSSADAYPIAFEEIAYSGMDYVALGDWHSMADYSRGSVKAFYSGSPEIIDLDQKGSGYVLLVEIAGETKISPLKIGSREVDELDISLDEIQDGSELREMILKGNAPNLIRTVNIKGFSDPELAVIPDELEEELQDKFFILRINDVSHPKIELIEEKNYPPETVIGRFIRLMKERIGAAATEEEKRIAEEALRIGVAELEGKEVIE